MMNQRRLMKTAAKALTDIIIVFLAVILLINIAPLCFGLKPYAVMTGSMSPTIKTGSLILVKKCGWDGIQVNDIATFESNKNPGERFTHRVIGKNDEDKTFTTKGDASGAVDSVPATLDTLVGKVVFYPIPFLGYPVHLLSSLFAKIAVFIIIVLWAALEIEIYILTKNKKIRKRSSE